MATDAPTETESDAGDQSQFDATPLRIGSQVLNSRLILGSGKYDSFELMRDSIEASATDCVTLAVRREKLNDSSARNILDFLPYQELTLLPNTAGCYDAVTAVRCAKLGRAILEGLDNPGQSWVKLEVLGNSRTLLPDPFELLKATETLVADGFDVLCYSNDDPVVARRLKDAGAAAVMPAGSPIGSGLGIANENNQRIILAELKRGDPDYPVILDAGVGTASDAVIAMELGFDAVLLNSAVAKAKNPIKMSAAMRLAVNAGRLAFEAGRMPTSAYGSASSPELGVISDRKLQDS
ncbi:thiazole synthase [Mariniblastus fucicola]|uniref:Thiazole synthase n=1 Tax=Mariniblastus fucicola TaxID=980251 RepID=A0A5B9PFM1_9BACT|nr:thiazole synthase [Mariniblastus fucicola]QEG23990.1 Thiazole synthase [Mariniblastus fucicola]